MSQYTKEWCRTFYNTMRFLEFVHKRLKNSDGVEVGRKRWGVKKDPQDPDDAKALVFFTFWPVKAKYDELGFYLSICPDQPEGDYPLWISPNDGSNEALRNRLQAAFPENMVIYDEDDWEVGLPLDIPADATDEQIWTMAKGLADKVI